MSIVQLSFHIEKKDGENVVKFVTIDYNDSDRPSNTGLVGALCWTIAKAVASEEENMMTQDLLNELNIDRTF